MATKVKKSYATTAKTPSTKKADEQKDLPKKDRIVAVDGIAAPVWRRVIAWCVDALLCFGATVFFLYSADIPGTSELSRWLCLLCAIISQLWFFAIIPTDYWPGQTVGAKLTRTYVRRVTDKKSLGFLGGLLRNYVYGMLGFLVVIPYEVISLCLQWIKKPTTESRMLQMLPYNNNLLIVPRDRLFKTEVVYLPKVKQLTEQDTGL